MKEIQSEENKGKRVRHALKPDAQGFDEVRLITRPRYKSSGLSGSEWRISVHAEFYRKGKLIHEEFCGHNMEGAVHAVGWKYGVAGDEGKMFFGGGEGGKCDQEGCAEGATVFYRMKSEKCNHYSHEKILLDKEFVIRQFCERHSVRGDCGFEDADDNYELIDGSIVKPRAEDVKESLFGGIVTLG